MSEAAIDIEVVHELKAVEQVAEEQYAVFVHEGRAWEERVLYLGTFDEWYEAEIEGHRMRTEGREVWSTISLSSMEPNLFRDGFVGLRPLAMPREAFAKMMIRDDIARQRYIAGVQDDWSVADEEDSP